MRTNGELNSMLYKLWTDIRYAGAEEAVEGTFDELETFVRKAAATAQQDAADAKSEIDWLKARVEELEAEKRGIVNANRAIADLFDEAKEIAAEGRARDERDWLARFLSNFSG